MSQLEVHERAARRQLGVGPDFQFFRFEWVRPDLMSLTGCVSSGVFKSGPRKGRQKYDGEPRTAYVLRSEIDAEAAAYRAETGNCSDCFGAGKRPSSWSKEHGQKFRPCETCGGTGKAPEGGDNDGQ